MFCPKCGKDAGDASFCPGCGNSLASPQVPPSAYLPPPLPAAPQKPKKPVYKRFWFWLLIVIALIIVIAVASSGGDGGSKEPATDANGQTIAATVKTTSTKAPPTEPETIKITAAQLVSEYQENGVKADNQYKGKLLEVTGTVRNIDKDLLDTVFITLNGGGDWSLNDVQCYFKDKEEIEKVAELSKGQTVTVIGTCNGLLIINVDMKNCKLK